MQYKLVVEEASMCEREVNRLLDEGWELHGSPAVAKQPGSNPEIIQALKKDD